MNEAELKEQVYNGVLMLAISMVRQNKTMTSSELNDGTKVKIMPVNHLSVGYSWDYWHKVISQFLDLKIQSND